MSRLCRCPFFVVAAGSWIAFAIAAHADDVVNGGFEAGYFRSWNTHNQTGGFGSFLLGRGSVTPLSGHASAGPAAGTFYAVLDQEGAGANALSFVFNVPAQSPSVVLVFDMFVDDWSGVGPIVSPAGLNYQGAANQHARVDILSADASEFNTTDGVLKNLYLSVDPGPSPHNYTHYEFDITDAVGGGGSFRLRFAAANNRFFLTMGVDNVGIFRGRAATVSLPAPYASNAEPGAALANKNSKGVGR